MASTIKIVAAVIVAIIAVVGVYAAFTFPKTAIDFYGIFGVETERELGEFEVPLLHESPGGSNR